jgi:hypothetical protein
MNELYKITITNDMIVTCKDENGKTIKDENGNVIKQRMIEYTIYKDNLVFKVETANFEELVLNETIMNHASWLLGITIRNDNEVVPETIPSVSEKQTSLKGEVITLDENVTE